MNHLLLIRKNLKKKDLIHQAEFFLASKPISQQTTQLNIRLIEQKAKRKKLHQAELHIATQCSRTSSAELNSRLAKKRSHDKRLHFAQMISMTNKLAFQ